jgi:acyl-CoA synthetase (AMP-forming)/AMP-acid ligase II
VKLGFVSLLTDLSSEMIFSVFAVFFTTVAGASSALLGLIEGLADFSASSLNYLAGWLSDRSGKRNMIVVSGFKVFPNEIEDVLALHADVLEAAAIGVADERTGEAVKVLVVRSDARLTEADLLAHCRQHLTGYKIPRFVEFRAQALPKSNLGKVLRRTLRDEDKAARDRTTSETAETTAKPVRPENH